MTAEEKREIIKAVRELVVADMKEEYFLMKKELVMQDNFRQEFAHHTLQFISEYRSVPIGDLINGTRKKEFVSARVEFYYIMRMFLKSRITLGEIAKFTSRDHATVLHSMKAIDNDMSTRKRYALEIHDMVEAFKKTIPDHLLKYTT